MVISQEKMDSYVSSVLLWQIYVIHAIENKMIAMLVGFLACPQGPQWSILPGTPKLIFKGLFFRSISIARLHSKMHFWGPIWPGRPFVGDFEQLSLCKMKSHSYVSRWPTQWWLPPSPKDCRNKLPVKWKIMFPIAMLAKGLPSGG